MPLTSPFFFFPCLFLAFVLDVLANARARTVMNEIGLDPGTICSMDRNTKLNGF